MAGAFRTTWDNILTSGLEHRMLGQIDTIGADEIQHSPTGYSKWPFIARLASCLSRNQLTISS